jgi:hypothetical protein
VDEDGDTKTMANVARWLKPGGWVYADVPCNPTYRVMENRHFRVYNEMAIVDRLLLGTMLLLKDDFFTSSEPQIGQASDVMPQIDVHPYHYCAFWAVKA